jgi:hypothetical protein
MAYLAFDESGIAPVEARAERPSEPTRLSPLEWTVVTLARGDTLCSLSGPGRVSAAIRALFKLPNPKLADARLEALRRMAVLSWHYGYTVPSRELRAFLSAGFTDAQYETMIASIDAARAKRA